MKNILIGLLIVVVLGLGGWILYDNTKNDSNAISTGSSNSGTNEEVTGGNYKTLVINH